MSRIGAVTGAIHPSMMSSMTSYRRLMILSAVLLQLAITVDSGAVLELQMLNFDNTNERNWDDSCCDLWCWSDCDHIFTFSLDLSSGNDDCKHYYYWTQKTRTYDNQNANVFNSDMKGVTNPIITQFITPGWPAAVKFKVYIEDDDSPITGNDPVDGIVQLLQLTPNASLLTASWRAITMQGVRPSHKTRLSMNFRLYCQPNYYSSDCSVYCLASDSNDGHYTCDPSTGNIVCRPGWLDPSSRCTRSTCDGNQCKNGATCVNGATSYTCTCAAGYTGVNCEGVVASTCPDDICSLVICMNGGTCQKSRCLCATGFTGHLCEININDCTESSCEHDGTCYDRVNGFTCDCLPDWEGPNCSQPVQPSNSSSSLVNYSFYMSDQPSSNINPVDAWFYASFCIILLLLIIIIILSARICRQTRRRRATSAPTTSASQPAAQRVESVENTYADAVILEGIGESSSTDKHDDHPKYSSVRKPASPPPRYSTVDNPLGKDQPHCDLYDEVFTCT